MNWEQLISARRFGMEERHTEKEENRTEFQRDYDRLIFSAPFRRLQNKTQVFPLPGSVFVHNRLTHSLEVSSVGRSLGNDVARLISKKKPHLLETNFMEIGSIVAASCLAHDLGNPPFGHSGEKAISKFFEEQEGAELKNMVVNGSRLTDEEWNDLIHFEGNANAFRLLTHQFKGRRKGGFALTYTTLASIVKYPYASSYANGKPKFGFFTTEKESYEKIAEHLGIEKRKEASGKYCRHPLVYLVEAADDICYQMMDIEDAHKLKIISTEETKDLFLAYFSKEKQDKLVKTFDIVSDKNEQIAYLRSSVIGKLIKECTNVFVENEEKILSGEFEGCLIDSMSETPHRAYANCSALAYKRIYRSQEVVDIELAGFKIISTLLSLMIDAVTNPEKTYSKLLMNRVSEQYDINAPTLYGRIQAVLDFVSGMTDVFALDLYRKINGNALPAV